MAIVIDGANIAHHASEYKCNYNSIFRKENVKAVVKFFSEKKNWNIEVIKVVIFDDTFDYEEQRELEEFDKV